MRALALRGRSAQWPCAHQSVAAAAAAAAAALNRIDAPQRNASLFPTLSIFNGATQNARPENAGLENDGQNFSQLWAKLRGLEDAEPEKTDHVN